MDLIVGSGKACLLVLTERVNREEIIRKLPNKKQERVRETVDRSARAYRGKFEGATRMQTN